MNVQVEVSIEVPQEDWIDYLTKETDIFMSCYSGYWAYGVKRDESLGWLVYEMHDEERPSASETKKALKAWKAGEALPQYFHKLDEAAAVKAFVEGAKRWGANWFEDKGDANTYDTVIQMALLGEVTYG